MGNQKVIGIDIGNSAVKTAEFTESGISSISRWDSVADLPDFGKDSKLVVCSVGQTELPGTFRDAMVLSYRTPLPIVLDYDTPETLGVDRIAAAVGAWALFPGENLLIIDGGTCITYDLVTAEGLYLGGVISPGLDMRLKAMHAFTQRLPRVDRGVPQLPGKTTKECLQLGADVALKHEIEGFLMSFNNKFPDLRVVTTGGGLPDFESNTKKHIFASSKIVLGGLHAIWKFNEGT